MDFPRLDSVLPGKLIHAVLQHSEIRLRLVGKQAHLGADVLVHVLMEVEMVLADVQQDAHARVQRRTGLQLETGQFQHHYIRLLAGQDIFGQRRADIAARMKLSEEDTSLAKMIALLHDIGRFEQLKQFDSFLPDTMDHAAYGVKILFDNAPHQNLIRNFIPESDFDEIIRISIAKHSDFKLDGISDARTLLHAKIIRDADKLDNCRVKLEDRLETFMDTSAEETGASAISPKVRDSILRHECILSSDRVTPMDYWISYLAYFYDINFRESLDIIEEQNYIPKIIARIPYTNPETKEVMKRVEEELIEYARIGLISSCP